jgi:hypothetical protein
MQLHDRSDVQQPSFDRDVHVSLGPRKLSGRLTVPPACRGVVVLTAEESDAALSFRNLAPRWFCKQATPTESRA